MAITEPASNNLHPANVLVLDDESTIRTLLSRMLEREGHIVMAAEETSVASAFLGQATPDIGIIDVYLGADSGIDFVRNLRESHPEMGIIVISGEDTETLANKALDSGADYFLSKPISPNALNLTVAKLLELKRQRMRSMDLERELDRSVRDTVFPSIVTDHDSMKAVLNLVQKVAPRDLSVLICGESGTGKELCARAIHQASNRRRGEFVELNCAALPPNLVESELFGHERGAFTGAISSRVGKIRQASGGTLFLDEIGELPLEIQPKLLRALQEKRIVPVGGKQAIECDFRLISATNRNLVTEVREGRFREDLFYRVAVFPIQLPTLRERPEDLELLLTHFLRLEGMSTASITPEARALLRRHDWPGNVRELKNFAQAITLYIDGDVIDEQSVRSYFGARMEMGGITGNSAVSSAPRDPKRPVRLLADVERDEILHALEYFKGNVSEAARALGMGRATLYKYIKRNDIDVPGS